jgi:transcription elongation factor GreA
MTEPAAATAADYEMTADGLAALQAEVARLEGEERRLIAEEIKTARGHGDLKENAEYHAAKEAQGHLETRILALRHQVTNAKVVEVSAGDVVAFGSVVTVVEESTGRESTYSLVSSMEADASAGRLSVESPVARALRGKSVGETATVATPSGERRLRVLAVA